MNHIFATHISAAHATVSVQSNRAEVAEWSRRYFGAWWGAREGTGGGVVVADVDEQAYKGLARLVDDGRGHEDVAFAKAPTRVARDGDQVIAVSRGEELAYRSDPTAGRLGIVGRRVEPVALAAARLARESIRRQLLRDGWAVLHASAAVRPADGATVLAFGDNGSGKTTTALLLASRGWSLLANDRVFVRPTETGIDVVPWPSAAALGLGLLAALGWYGPTRERLLAGERLHPTQHQDVTDALLAGHRIPLWEPDGKRERKVQIFPDQFPAWFNVPLATNGRATALLFPRIEPEAAPGLVDGGRSLGQDDFMSGATEDRYPDIFRLAHGIDGGGRPGVRAEVADRLAALPHYCLRLNHDPATSADFLSRITA